MPTAPPPAKPLPPARRAFEPARYAQAHLARAYLQLVPGPSRATPPRPGASAAGGAAPRPAAAS